MTLIEALGLGVGVVAAVCIIVAMIAGASPYLLRKLTEEQPQKISDLTPRGVMSTAVTDRQGKTTVTYHKRHVAK